MCVERFLVSYLILLYIVENIWDLSFFGVIDVVEIFRERLIFGGI